MTRSELSQNKRRKQQKCGQERRATELRRPASAPARCWCPWCSTGDRLGCCPCRVQHRSGLAAEKFCVSGEQSVEEAGIGEGGTQGSGRVGVGVLSVAWLESTVRIEQPRRHNSTTLEQKKRGKHQSNPNHTNPTKSKTHAIPDYADKVCPTSRRLPPKLPISQSRLPPPASL